MNQKHYTIKDFEREFPDDDACLGWMMQSKYPDGVFCQKCQRITKRN